MLRVFFYILKYLIFVVSRNPILARALRTPIMSHELKRVFWKCQRAGALSIVDLKKLVSKSELPDKLIAALNLTFHLNDLSDSEGYDSDDTLSN